MTKVVTSDTHLFETVYVQFSSYAYFILCTLYACGLHVHFRHMAYFGEKHPLRFESSDMFPPWHKLLHLMICITPSYSQNISFIKFTKYVIY